MISPAARALLLLVEAEKSQFHAGFSHLQLSREALGNLIDLEIGTRAAARDQLERRRRLISLAAEMGSRSEDVSAPLLQRNPRKSQISTVSSALAALLAHLCSHRQRDRGAA